MSTASCRWKWDIYRTSLRFVKVTAAPNLAAICRRSLGSRTRCQHLNFSTAPHTPNPIPLAICAEAARSLIREKGYENTTLDDIAARAGMTTGAIYGNFKNRDELFIRLGQTYWPPIKPQVNPGASFATIMRAMADATIAAIPDRRAAAVGRLTGLAYTL